MTTSLFLIDVLGSTGGDGRDRSATVAGAVIGVILLLLLLALVLVFVILPYMKKKRADEKVAQYRHESVSEKTKRGLSVTNAAYEAVGPGAPSEVPVYDSVDDMARSRTDGGSLSKPTYEMRDGVIRVVPGAATPDVGYLDVSDAPSGGELPMEAVDGMDNPLYGSSSTDTGSYDTVSTLERNSLVVYDTAADTQYAIAFSQ